MLRFRTLRPFVQVAFFLALWAFVINGTLLALSDTPLLRWLPEHVSGTGFVEDNRQRVIAAVQEYAERKVDASQYLGAIVGISTVREGVNLDVLSGEAGPRWRFIGIGGAGGGVYSVKENADVLLDSALRPDLVVLGFTAGQILDSMLPWASETAASPTAAPTRLSRESLYSTLRNLSWATDRRQDVSITVEQALLNARAQIFELLDVRPTSPDHRSPWREMMRLMGAEHFPEATLRSGLKTAETKGMFSIEAFDQSVEAPRLMAELIGKFRDRGAEVLVVLTPMHSWWRTREPQGLDKYFKDALKTFLPGDTIQFVDYRAALDDDEFVDLMHLNSKGSRKFSRLLATDIERFKFTRPSLMSSSQ